MVVRMPRSSFARPCRLPPVPFSDPVAFLLADLGVTQERQRFYEANSFAECQRRLAFTTTQRAQGDTIYEYYSEVEVTLHPVFGGSAKTTGISEVEVAKC